MGPAHEATLSGSNSPPLGCLYHCSELYSGCKSLRSAPWSAPVSRSPDWSPASSSQCSTLCTAPVALLLFPQADPSSCTTIHGFVISPQTYTYILPYHFIPQLLRHNTRLWHISNILSHPFRPQLLRHKNGFDIPTHLLTNILPHHTTSNPRF